MRYLISPIAMNTQLRSPGSNGIAYIMYLFLVDLMFAAKRKYYYVGTDVEENHLKFEIFLYL